MEVFLQQLINGITLGSIYGLIAIGYTMVFGIIGMVNFAHGDVFMVSAFIALIAFLILTTWLGITSIMLALLVVLVVAMLFTSAINWAIEDQPGVATNRVLGRRSAPSPATTHPCAFSRSAAASRQAE